MTSEVTIINVEVGNMSLESINRFIKQLKDVVSKQFDTESMPKIVFVPTRDGVCRCTIAGPSESIKIITCSGKTLDLNVQDLLDTYGKQIMENFE